ncbi:MAG: amidohydrolase family protein [Cephaloticoccus sp.]|nr:amidohydrolase family protein [Cephaloticoccus sp.]MCF7761928.1 amidohydrolase family protein [Cephaloticoccus sp.]
MIIDVHTHLNNYDETKEVPLAERLAQLQESMAFSKVDAAMILTSYTVNAHRPSTREVVELTQDIDSLHVVAGISFLNYRERDLRELSDYLKAGLVKGLKLYPGYEPFYPHDSRCRVLYDLALEFDVPVMVHTGDTYTPKGKVRYAHPLHLDDVAVDFPDLKLVICHVGNPWIRDCMEVVYKNKNVHADISGLVLGDFTERFETFMVGQLKEMILYAGDPHYLLYGTDWPICRMRTYLKFVRGLGLPPEHEEQILWKNTNRLFKLGLKAT